MTNIYLQKLAIDAGVAKATAKYLGKDLIYAGGASVAGAAAGAEIGKKVNKKNPKAGSGWGAFAGSHIAAAPVSVALAYHAMKGMAKRASDNKPSKFKMPTDKPSIATKEELLDKINDGLLKRDQIVADQQTQVWKETKRTNDIKEKEVGKMDKMKLLTDVAKTKIQAKAKSKGAKK